MVFHTGYPKFGGRVDVGKLGSAGGYYTENVREIKTNATGAEYILPSWGNCTRLVSW